MALGIIAVMVGVAAGVLLFVPFVAVSYRRRGRITLGRSLLWFAALVYFWAIWTYTLLPLPDPDTIRCVGVITDPLSVAHELRTAFAAPGDPLLHPALLQLAFNVLLFVPLGGFLRVLADRGVLTAAAVGLGVSLLVETTQLTGVWGVYPCAYRFFDVGDLMTNTAGAVLGSLFALIVPRAKRGMAVSPDAGAPRPVTRGRRALGMLCDGLTTVFVGAGASVVVQLWLAYVVGDRAAVLDGTPAGWIGTAAASALQLVAILLTGRSVGDLAVQLRYAGGRMPEPIARVLRWAGGIGGIGALSLLGGWLASASSLLAVVAVVLLFTTRAGRGLPGILTGRQLADARSGATGPLDANTQAVPITDA